MAEKVIQNFCVTMLRPKFVVVTDTGIHCHHSHPIVPISWWSDGAIYSSLRPRTSLISTIITGCVLKFEPPSFSSPLCNFVTVSTPNNEKNICHEALHTEEKKLEFELGILQEPLASKVRSFLIVRDLFN